MPLEDELSDIAAPPPYNNADERRDHEDKKWLEKCLKDNSIIFRSYPLPELEENGSTSSATDTPLPAWVPTSGPLVGIEGPMTAFKASLNELVLHMRYFAERADHPEVRKICDEIDTYSKFTLAR